MMFKKLTPIVLAFLLFANLSCSPKCESALADLITNIAFSGLQTIVAGTPFDVPNLIENAKNTTQECKGDILETIGAGASESRLKIDFDESANGGFALNKLNNNFTVPEIPAGMKAEEKYSFSFNEPGDYRLITFCDDKSDVAERDESNNESADANAKAGRYADPSMVREPLIIRVLPNPNFVKKPGQPDVEILSRTVRIIE